MGKRLIYIYTVLIKGLTEYSTMYMYIYKGPDETCQKLCKQCRRVLLSQYNAGY